MATSRPNMPGGLDSEEQRRSKHMASRSDLLRDVSQERVKEWMEAHISSERLRLWGHADVSANPLAGFARQASTPGLYINTPWRAGPPGSEGLIGPTGLLVQGGYWTKMHHTQYMAVGMNTMVLRVAANEDTRRLVFRHVYPHDCYCIAHPDAPTVPVQFAELRLRSHREGDEMVSAYVWDVWDISDLDAPSFSIHEALITGGVGPDVTSRYGTQRREGATGEYRYPYWSKVTGRPVIPYVIYHAVDDGTMWSWEVGRATLVGALNSMLNWSFAQHCARDATGITAMVFDATPVNTKTTIDPKTGQPVTNVIVEPGTAQLWQTREGSSHQGKVQAVGPGQQLDSVMSYAIAYEGNVHARMGLNATDISRMNNTPTSGAAIYLSNEGKRQLQEKYKPLFERGDLEMFTKAAIVANAHGFGDFPEGPYSVTYRQIPLSVQEQAARREDLDWRVANGLMSEVERYQEIYPGTTQEHAIQAIARNRATTKQIGDEAQRLALTRPLPPSTT